MKENIAFAKGLIVVSAFVLGAELYGQTHPRFVSLIVAVCALFFIIKGGKK